MKKLSVTFMALLLVIATFHPPANADSAAPAGPSINVRNNEDYHPVVTPFYVREYKGWKNSERFEFSYVDGFQEIYNPEEPITFSFEGKSDKLYVDDANGFSATAWLFNLLTNQGTRADVIFDSSKRTWQVKIDAPKDNTGKYMVLVNLFCQKRDFPCAEAYGFGTQIDKTLPLKVR
jgi:hypothetical protein